MSSLFPIELPKLKRRVTYFKYRMKCAKSEVRKNFYISALAVAEKKLWEAIEANNGYKHDLETCGRILLLQKVIKDAQGEIDELKNKNSSPING